MFTGLVESVGKLVGRSGEHIRVRPARRLDSPQFGESVAVNGCCLTLERDFADGTLEFFTLAETLDRTNLGRLPIGSAVNLERALRLGDRLGGHLVSGHIDCVTPVLSFAKCADGDFELTVELPELLAPEVVEKGSIAIDGVSLTVVRVTESSFAVRLIPVTRAETALAGRTPGTLVNLEGDLIGKYVLRQLALRAGSAEKTERSGSSISMETLREAGFL